METNETIDHIKETCKTIKKIQDQLNEIIKKNRSIDYKQDILAEQIKFTQCIIASFHPDPVLRKYANSVLKEATEYLDNSRPETEVRDGRAMAPSDTLFISQMFYELAQTFAKAAPNRTPES